MRDRFDELYANLEIEMQKFRKAFISESFIELLISPIPQKRYKDLFTSYSEEVKIQMHAYIVSTHGLFERFFEDTAREIAEKSQDIYRRKRKINRFLDLLIKDEKNEISKTSYKENIQNSFQIIFNKKKDSENIENFKENADIIVTKTINDFLKYLENNHTIINNTSTGIYDMLCRVGIENIRNRDVILYQQFINFIKERGDFAHQGVVKTISPATAQTYIDNALLIAQDVAKQSKALLKT